MISGLWECKARNNPLVFNKIFIIGKERIIMSREEILEQVLNMVAMAYKKDVSELSETTSFKTDLNGASVQMVALVSEIENELDVALMLADASGCETISDLIDLIEEEM